MSSQNDGVMEMMKFVEPNTSAWLDDRAIGQIAKIETADDFSALRAQLPQGSTDRAPFNLLAVVSELVALAATIRAVWEFVEFADDATELFVDDNKKLAIAERAIQRLRQLGLSNFADKVEAWTNSVLEQMTRPSR